MKENFRRSFTAASFAEFWRYWNPVYGYYLRKLVYRPLRKRRIPKALAVIATFAFSGFFLHDVLSWPVVVLKTGTFRLPHTCTWFVLIACSIALSEWARLRFDRLPAAGRVLVHALLLASTYAVGEILVKATS